MGQGLGNIVECCNITSVEVLTVIVPGFYVSVCTRVCVCMCAHAKPQALNLSKAFSLQLQGKTMLMMCTFVGIRPQGMISILPFAPLEILRWC